MKKIYIVFLFFVSIIQAHATSIVLENNKIYSFSAEDISYIKDSTNSLTISELINNKHNIPYKAFTSSYNNFSFSRSTFWIKIDIKNLSAVKRNLYFNIPYPLLNDVQLYKTKQNKIVSFIQTGENFPHATREIPSENYIFSLTTDSNESITYYIRIYNENEVTKIPIELIDELSHNQFSQKTQYINILFYGFILFAFLFNLILFIQLRKKAYAYLVAFIVSIIIFLFYNDGYAFQYLWPNLPTMSNTSLVLFSMLANIFTALFAYEFLKYSKIPLQALFIILASSIGVILWSFLPDHFTQQCVMIANLVVLLTVIYVLYKAFRDYRAKKTTYGLLNWIAYLSLLSGAIIYVLLNFTIVPYNFYTQYALKLGFGIEIIMLTFATMFEIGEVLRATNATLEAQVKKRTHIISAQNSQLREKNETIESQYKEICDSINYAKKIQHAILPNINKFASLFKEHFILFKPKDIVSGDFYWIVSEHHGKTYIAVADCTGHGVPGAFLSMLGISFLNQILSSNEHIQPNEILNELRVLFGETLRNSKSELQEEDAQASTDSMDISICMFDHTNNTMEYAGAFNSIIVIRGNEHIELTVDRVPLDTNYRYIAKSYENYEFQTNPNDRIYLFSDGYYDQFGGHRNKRLSKRRFHELLVESSILTLPQQYQFLEKNLEEWKGQNEQVDDILILGLLV